jgi:hypothetical protein
VTVFRSNASFTKRSVSSRIACFDISFLFAFCTDFLHAPLDVDDAFSQRSCELKCSQERRYSGQEPWTSLLAFVMQWPSQTIPLTIKVQ